MSTFAVYIQKREAYFGGVRTFGNTYHYTDGSLVPFNDAGIVAEIVAAEKLITQITVEFVEARTWGPTDGSEFDNVMREIIPLSGTGAGANIPNMYREASLLVAWPLPRSPATNRNRWLRKFIRLPGLSGFTDGQVGGYEALSQSQINSVITNYGNAVRSVGTAPEAWDLSTEDGTKNTGDALVREFLTTREIGR